MRRPLMSIAVAVVFATAGICTAQVQSKPAQAKRTPVVNHRQVVQHRRIVRGVRSGQLTKSEARKLSRQQARIRRTKRRDRRMNGGKLTSSERKHLDRMQNRANRHIYRLKHNKRKRH